MHASVWHVIARQNPYAAAGMSRASRQGRNAAQDVAVQAAARARRVAADWRVRTRERQLVRLVKEAGIMLKSPPELTRRIARRLGWRRLPGGFGVPERWVQGAGERFVGSVDRAAGIATIADYGDGPGAPPDLRVFGRTTPPAPGTPRFEFDAGLREAWDAVFDLQSGRPARLRRYALPAPDEYRRLVAPGPPRKRPPARAAQFEAL